MYLEELKEREQGEEELSGGADLLCKSDGAIVLRWDTKRILVGAGARALFYPTLLYNVVRNKIQAEFRCLNQWFVLLGAVPFPSDIHRLKELGVCGVVTLNESYETLVPSSLYEAHGIQHLVLPTRDYLFAPSLSDICEAVDFIHGKDCLKLSASTSVLLFDLSFSLIPLLPSGSMFKTASHVIRVKYRQMMPDVAYNYVKSIRPRVLLASAQWKAVQEFYHLKVKGSSSSRLTDLFIRSPRWLAARDIFAFDDCSMVVVTQSDLDGYDPEKTSVVRNEIWADLNLIYQVKIVSEAALAKLSCLWVHYHGRQKTSSEKLTSDGGGTVGTPPVGNIDVDIHVFS
ncbi:hypothetical protein DH2020_005256 [Rehmannia glutinosa]|uniref:Dual specificity protein phosphatase DSP8 n=1 Tax=Rehmannia glutinosa TaxID=99300 RepID=A0ABR0XFJ9_REHGL